MPTALLPRAGTRRCRQWDDGEEGCLSLGEPNVIGVVLLLLLLLL